MNALKDVFSYERLLKMIITCLKKLDPGSKLILIHNWSHTCPCQRRFHWVLFHQTLCRMKRSLCAYHQISIASNLFQSFLTPLTCHFSHRATCGGGLWSESCHFHDTDQTSGQLYEHVECLVQTATLSAFTWQKANTIIITDNNCRYRIGLENSPCRITHLVPVYMQHRKLNDAHHPFSHQGSRFTPAG